MLVSILIPCFNAEPWIGECIESALAQTWPEKEVIVVDDGSTDGSLDIVRRFGDRIRWESGPNRGGNAARNRLFELARGEWLQYLDADDYLKPAKVQRQAEFAALHPDCEIVISPVILERQEGNHRVWVETRIPDPRDPWILLALWQLPQTGGPLWKKSALEKVNAWRVEQPCCQEHELYFRLLAAGCRFAFCDSCLAVHRALHHPERITYKFRYQIVEQRLLIVDRVERFLRQCGELSPARRQAVNDARHELARWAWGAFGDKALASDVVRQIAASDPRFQPSQSDASPTVYRLAYRLAGFDFAQRIAAVKRGLAANFRLHDG